MTKIGNCKPCANLEALLKKQGVDPKKAFRAALQARPSHEEAMKVAAEALKPLEKDVAEIGKKPK
jgi:hypothetical protein